MKRKWTCGHQVLKEACEALRFPLDPEELAQSLPVIGADGASSVDMVVWLEGRGLRVKETKVSTDKQLAAVLDTGPVAFAALLPPGATQLHWVLLTRTIGGRKYVVYKDVRVGQVVEKYGVFLSKIRSPFWVVSRR